VELLLPINLYINRHYQEYIDQLTVIAESNEIPLSTEICEAIKQYIQTLNDEKELLAPNKLWNDFFKKATKEELHSMSRLICGLNDRIVKKLCQ
jgi:hypothetical protein